MTSTPSGDTGATVEDALKRRLLNRIAVAAVMVVGLLGSLAIFDAIYAPKRPAKMVSLPAESADTAPAEARTEAKPAETAGLSGVAGIAGLSAAAASGAPAVATHVTAATAVAAAPVTPSSPAAAPGKPEPKAVAEGTSAAGAPPLQPLPPEKGLTKPATAKMASVRPSEPVAPASSLAARPDPGRVIARAPRSTTAAGTPGVAPRAPASRPLSRAADPHFALQMGVFTNLANAEDLRAKLELHGIPSTIEARVHVGPFATREEADAARAKLKELGLDGGLLVSLKK